MCEVVVWEFKTGMFTGIVGWDVEEHVCSEEEVLENDPLVYGRLEEKVECKQR